MFYTLILSSFLIAFCLTYGVKQYALKKGIQNAPDERSSHEGVIPHGGGFAITVAYIFAIIVGYFLGYFDQDVILTIVLCGGIISMVGFFDDHKPMSVSVRIAIQFACAIVAIWLLEGFPKISYGWFILDWGIYGYIIGVFALVWLTNLYNFMDGIDGFASIEAMTTTGCMALILLINSKFESVWQLNILLVASVLGFFFWNFPKAKIFMGDVGSYFLGFVMGVLMIKSWYLTIDIIFSWVILLTVFITDATYTLVVRIVRGERFYLPHRSHAYQIISRKYDSHIKVSTMLIFINIGYLFPIAFLVATKDIHPLTGLAITYIPMILLAAFVKAGIPERKVSD